MNKYLELKGKCKTCLGCNKLEDKTFRGVYECKEYMEGIKFVGPFKLDVDDIRESSGELNETTISKTIDRALERLEEMCNCGEKCNENKAEESE